MFIYNAICIYVSVTSTSYLSKSIVVSSVTITSTASLSSSTGNSKFYDNTKKVSINELPESVSPLSVSSISFTNISEEIGPIPPPRMFSDAVISTLQAADAVQSSQHNADQIKIKETELNTQRMTKNVNVNGNESGSRVEPLIAQISNLNVNNYLNGELFIEDYLVPYDYEDEWSSPYVEEVPAKEPQFSAVPKKSALKKPKNQNNFTFIASNSNGPSDAKPFHLTQSNITNGYVATTIVYHSHLPTFCITLQVCPFKDKTLQWKHR